MLTFRNTLTIFILLMAGFIIYDYNHEISVWIYAVTFVAASLVVAWGCYFIQSDFFVSALCEGDRGKNEIAITFDDGPHENTPVLLDILGKHKVQAAFFCIGKNISGRENIMKRITEEGHVVGNHSYSHDNLIDLWPLKKLVADVSHAENEILRATGKKCRLFRPPYGVTTPLIAKLVMKKKFTVIGWSVRSYDTTIKDKDKLMKRIFRLMRSGSVILLHDSTPGIDIVLEKILGQARQMNLNVVGIEKLLGIKAYETK
jgi:peptidoglycan/xylan/chitin deacetylase (PgdA/CDA1 family)